MSMKRKIILIVLLTAGIVYGCQKKPKQIGEFLLGSYKVYNPYNGDETLLYKHSVNKSILTFYGDGRYSEFVEYAPTNNPTIDYWINERNLCSFTTEDERYTLRIDLETHWNTAVEMLLRYNEQVRIDTFYKKGPTYRLPLSIDFFNPPNIDRFYLDSLQVFSKCYNDVFAKRAPNGGLYPYSQSLQNPEIRPTTFYYTVNEGIIRIDFNDSSYWGLTEIISP